MTFAPKHDWKVYADAIREAQEVRKQAQASPPVMEEAFCRYTSYFDVLHQARRDLQVGSDLDWDKAQESRWHEKIALRQRLLKIYRARDTRNGQPTSGSVD